MADVFISYSHDDSEQMYAIRDRLVSEGLSVWTDEQLTPGTERWFSVIGEEIEQSHAVVALLSPSAKRSRFVNKELYYAELHGCRVFPMLIKGTPQSALPLFIDDIWYTDIRDDADVGLTRLTGKLQSHIAELSDSFRASTLAALQAAHTRSTHYFPGAFTSKESRGWPRNPLGKIVEWHNNRRSALNEGQRIAAPADYPFYGASGVIDHIGTYDFDGEYLLLSAVGRNLITRRMPVAFRASGRFSANTGVHVLLPCPEIILFDYLLYYLCFMGYEQYVTGDRYHLNVRTATNIPVVVPPISDQRSQVHNYQQYMLDFIRHELDVLDQTRAVLQRDLVPHDESLIAQLEQVFTREY